MSDAIAELVFLAMRADTGCDDDNCALVSNTVSRLSPLPTCMHCGKPPTCSGSYETSDDFQFACDVCCGHGNEDGMCERFAVEPNQHTDDAAGGATK